MTPDTPTTARSPSCWRGDITGARDPLRPGVGPSSPLATEAELPLIAQPTMATGAKSWAQMAQSKPAAEPAKPKPAAPPSEQPAAAPQENGAAATAAAPVKAEPKMNGAHPSSRGPLSSSGSAGVPVSYEPMPNEIRRVILNKPDAGAKLGIRLAGDDRPRIVGLNPEMIASKSGGLNVNDVILTVNGQRAQGHAGTTAMLKAAVGQIKVGTPPLQSRARNSVAGPLRSGRPFPAAGGASRACSSARTAPPPRIATARFSPSTRDPPKRPLRTPCPRAAPPAPLTPSR